MDNKDNNSEEEKEQKKIDAELEQEPENVTREINLDDLYDGAINNTVTFDPVTHDELFIRQKRPNYTLVGIFVAVAILLVLYYVNNKTDLGRTTKKAETKTTTTVTTTVPVEEKIGSLNCTYSSKSDAETQSITFVADYEDSKIISSKFNYAVMSTTDTISAVVENLRNQYESFYISNVAVSGYNVIFEKDDKGFTFETKTNYSSAVFDQITLVDGQTVLYVKPAKEDTPDSLKQAYTDKGFTCNLTSNEETK